MRRRATVASEPPSAASRRGDLLGPYDWAEGDAPVIGLAEVTRVFGRDAAATRLHALLIAYRKAYPPINQCAAFRLRGGRVGFCVRRKNHDPASQHRWLLISLVDSRVIVEAARRVVEPVPIPEVNA